MMIWIALALALAGDPSAAPQDAKPVVPHWIRTPASVDLMRYYPRKAMADRVQGRGVAGCTVAEDGHLTSCVVLSETPAGYGFGEATVKIAEKVFRVSPKNPDGASTVGAHVQVPIRWSLG